MKADHWSMIVFWNEAKGTAARRGPDVGLDFTDQPAPAPEVPQPAANDDDGQYPGYEDTTLQTCLWTRRICHRRVNSPNRTLTMVLSSWVPVTIHLLLLPEAAPLCR